VQVQAGASRTAFFFLHGDIDSGGFFCRRLARALGPDVTMYAVQPHGLNGAALPDSVEEMAAERLRSIVEIQPAGPYHIGGFCGGGIIAYEMARQLHARGEQVAPLLLIDARPPNLAYRSDWALARRTASALRLSPRVQRALFLRLKWYREELQASGRTGLLGWTHLLWRKLSSVAARAMTGGVESGAADQAAGQDPASLLARYQERLSAHMPGPYAGQVALFRSSYRDGRPWFDSAAGWGMLGAHEDLHRIPGNHRTCVTTHVADLAALMRPYLLA
jgi:thioesterase domain-containing protein